VLGGSNGKFRNSGLELTDCSSVEAHPWMHRDLRSAPTPGSNHVNPDRDCSRGRGLGPQELPFSLIRYEQWCCETVHVWVVRWKETYLDVGFLRIHQKLERVCRHELLDTVDLDRGPR